MGIWKNKPPKEKAAPKPTNILPRHVEDCLVVATYVLRTADPIDGPRVMMSAPQLGNFIVADDLQQRVERAFPELNARQVARFLGYVKAGTQTALRTTDRPGKPKRNWVSGGSQESGFPIRMD
ncbi:hypothetical protein ACMX25_18260 [Caballeronia sp. 15715]|uniref:hypothetical protein n=1 Tax=Caballeronia sp. 15715 TaxID=3391030 RepID=UPI0039E468BB